MHREIEACVNTRPQMSNMIGYIKATGGLLNCSLRWEGINPHRCELEPLTCRPVFAQIPQAHLLCSYPKVAYPETSRHSGCRRYHISQRKKLRPKITIKGKVRVAGARRHRWRKEGVRCYMRHSRRRLFKAIVCPSQNQDNNVHPEADITLFEQSGESWQRRKWRRIKKRESPRSYSR
jgi:hypothetical protein